MMIRIMTAASLLLCGTASAGPAYSIDWSTIDGGGGTSTGGVYTISGTIGQHDASGALSGGVYTVTGGFWAGVGVGPTPCNPADLAEPFGVLDLGDIGAFVGGFTTQNPVADLDDNGIFDLADIGLFVGAFTGGCP